MVTEDKKSLLSKREAEVLQAVAQGMSNQEAADTLGISANTVRVHLRNIFSKIEVQSRTEATMWAIQQGLIEPETPETEEDSSDQDRPADGRGSLIVPHLEPWQRLYFFAALVVAVLILATPIIPPMLNQMNDDTFSDQPQPIRAEPTTTLSGNRWAYEAEMPTARTRLTMVYYADELYVIGGIRTSGPTGLVEVFDLDTASWREAAGKPTPAADIEGVMIDDKIYVPGGCSGEIEVSDRLEIFDPQANTWRNGAALPQALCAYAATAYEGRLYLIGGWNGSAFVDTVLIYDPQSDRWEQSAPPYPLRLGFAGAATFDDKIYVVGGYDGRREYAAVYIFDPTAGTWTEGPALNEPRGGIRLAAVNDDLYAIGGGWTKLITSSERFRPVEGRWEAIETPYPAWRNFGLAVVGTDIYAAGGWNGKYLDLVVAYPTIFRVFLPVLQ